MAELSQDTSPDEYVLTFKNGALQKLRELAQRLDVHEEDLDQVVSKGLKVLDLAQDNKIKVRKDSDDYIVDLKKI